MIITIDGPALSGKSSAAKLLAQKLGYYYYSSGMLYRACAYILKEYAGYSKSKLHDPNPATVAFYCNPRRLVYAYDIKHGARILFDDNDITAYLRSPEIDEYASIVGTVESVRIEILALQNNIIQEHTNIVADGRDMGSVAFPQAEYKFFLTASVQARARRALLDKERYSEQDKQKMQQQIEQFIIQRDQRDTIRPYAPLVMPENAIGIDSTDMTLEQVVDTMLQHIQTKKAS